MPKIMLPEERRIMVHSTLRPDAVELVDFLSQNHTKGNRSRVIEKLIGYFINNPEAISSVFPK